MAATTWKQFVVGSALGVVMGSAASLAVADPGDLGELDAGEWSQVLLAEASAALNVIKAKTCPTLNNTRVVRIDLRRDGLSGTRYDDIKAQCTGIYPKTAAEMVGEVSLTGQCDGCEADEIGQIISSEWVTITEQEFSDTLDEVKHRACPTLDNDKLVQLIIKRRALEGDDYSIVDSRCDGIYPKSIAELEGQGATLIVGAYE